MCVKPSGLGVGCSCTGGHCPSVHDADVLAFATRSTNGYVPLDARAAGYRLLEHLRKHGYVLPEPPSASAAIEREVTAYDEHLRTAASLALATRRYRQRFAREFLIAVFGHRPIRWNRIQVEDVRTFLAGYA